MGAVTLLPSLQVGAEEEHGHQDVLVFQSGGQVQMGGLDVDCYSGVGEPGCDPNGSTGERVYEAELEGGVAEEPGFFSVSDAGVAALPFGDNLPAGAAHAIDFIFDPTSTVPGASILFWSGTGGSVTWSSAPNLESFQIEGSGGSDGLLVATSELLGIQLDAPDLGGGFDTHPDFILNGGGGAATVGFYALFGRTNIAGLTSSDPWAVVFDFGVEDEELHEMAVEYLAAALPEPGALTLLCVGLAGFALAGRRKTAC